MDSLLIGARKEYARIIRETSSINTEIYRYVNNSCKTKIFGTLSILNAAARLSIPVVAMSKRLTPTDKQLLINRDRNVTQPLEIINPKADTVCSSNTGFRIPIPRINGDASKILFKIDPIGISATAKMTIG